MQPNTNNPKPKSIQEFLPGFCDRCGSRFGSTDYEIISQEVNRSVCKIQCTQCHNTFIMHFSTPTPGVATSLKLPITPTLTSTEINKFSRSEKIEKEEILDVYLALKDVSTIEDFNLLFQSSEDDIV